MSEQDEASKTEEPTPKRLQESRERGQVVQSRDVNHVIILAAATLIAVIFSPMLMTKIYALGRGIFEQSYEIQLDADNLRVLATEIITKVGLILILPMIILVVAAFMAGYLQFGLLFSTDTITPDLSKISPIAGFGRLFSLRSVVELVKGLIKIAIVGAIGLSLIWPQVGHADLFVMIEAGELLHVLQHLTTQFLIGVIVTMIVVAALDYGYQRFQFYKRMRMTKQELKDEYKQSEGDPMIKARLRKLRNERARKRMMAAVPEATVIVTNPTHYAVALKYEFGMRAPVLLAKGLDLVAYRIRELAKTNRIPIVENPPVARLLHATVDIDHEIHPDQYKAVAEIISYVMKLRSKQRPVTVPIPGLSESDGDRNEKQTDGFSPLGGAIGLMPAPADGPVR